MIRFHLLKLNFFLFVSLILTYKAQFSENLINNKTWHEQLKTLFNTSDPNIGTNADVNPKEAVLLQESNFKDLSIDDGKLFFDFGNNVVNGAVNSRGSIQRGIVFSKVRQKKIAAPPGVWCHYSFFNACRFEHFGISTQGKTTYIDDKGLKQQTRLIEGSFPMTSTNIGDLKIKQVVMAPYQNEEAIRGILVGFYIETNSTNPIEASLVLPKEKKGMGRIGPLTKWVNAMPVENKDEKEKSIKYYGKVKTVLLDGLEDQREQDLFHFKVSKGKPVWIGTLVVMDENEATIPSIYQQTRKLNSKTLVQHTVDHFRDRVGTLNIEGKVTPFASLIKRKIHAQLITMLRNKQKKPVGSSWGQDASEPVKWGQEDRVWMHDSFYNYLSAGIVDRELLLDGINFYLTKSVPEYPSIYHAFKSSRIKPDERRLPHSIGNAVTPIVLAGKYYELYGGINELKAIKEKSPQGKMVDLKEVMVSLLDSILASRKATEPMLFETFFLSDPRTHGKYHTGTNILTWHAFQSAATILADVYHENEKASFYQKVANQMKQDIPTYCIIKHNGQPTYSEGYEAGELSVEGEESGTVIASALGYCAQDDQAMLARFKFGSSKNNPSWNSEVGGMMWKDRCITFPGYTTEFAAASTEDELKNKMNKLLNVSDVDGSWWWWPMSLQELGVEKRAWVGKCGWANGTFLIHFYDKILGLNWNAPNKTLSFRPFIPWEKFSYQNLTYGSLHLDVAYENTAKGAVVNIDNKQDINTFDITLRAPVGTKQCKIINAPKSSKLTQSTDYFGKPTWKVSLNNVKQGEVKLEVAWK